MPRDAWIALAVAAASAASLWELARTPGTGAFVKTTTFPSAVCVLLMALALLHFAGAWLRRVRVPAAAGTPPEGPGIAPPSGAWSGGSTSTRNDGRLSRSMTSRSAKTTARAIAFSSSRTFPGQG